MGDLVLLSIILAVPAAFVTSVDLNGPEYTVIVSNNAIVRSSSVWVNGTEGSNLNSLVDGVTSGSFELHCAMTYYEVEDAYFELDLTRMTQISKIDIYGLDLSQQNGAGNLNGARVWLEKMVPGSTVPATLDGMVVEQDTIFASFTLPVDKAVQYVVVGRSTTVRFALCEIVVWSTDVVSMGANVSMSSVRQDPPSHSWGPELAIDEPEEPVRTTAQCMCCAATQSQTLDPWLQVDLGLEHRVSALTLYSRTDSEEDMLDGTNIFFTAYTEDIGDPHSIIDQPLTFVHLELIPDHVTRYVTLTRKSNSQSLTICEIRVFGRICGNKFFGEGCNTPCGKCDGDVTCDVIDGHCEACQPGYNDDKCLYALISTGKTMLSSSELAYPESTDLWKPSRAIDGNSRKDMFTCGCCAGTLVEEDPWMTLDLHGPHRISKIIIIGTSNIQYKLLYLNIYLSEYAKSWGSLWHFVNYTIPDNTITVTVTPDVGARYVTLQLPGHLKRLIVCEIEVFGMECPPYRYGPLCSLPCGHCLHGLTCSGASGICDRCEPGYSGPTCKQDCYPGSFGQDCVRTCGACFAQAPCDHVTGECVSCEEDFYGAQCKYHLVSKDQLVNASSVKSEPSVYFWEPSKAVDGDSRTDPSVCQCCAATSVEISPWLQVDLGRAYRIALVSVFGQTDDPQYTLEHLEIHLNRFSDLTLPVYTETENVTYTETLVFPVKPSDVITLIFGPNRGMTELHVCEVKVFAEDCDLGMFGTNCSSICRCHENLPCNGLTGQCPDELCAIGWQGDTCSEECPDGLFGMNCSSLCGFCKDNIACEKSTGYCLGGCDTLYTGLWCKELLPTMTENTVILGVTLGGLAFLFAGMAVGIRRMWNFYKARKRWGYQPPFEGFPEDWAPTEVEIQRKQAELQGTHDQEPVAQEKFVFGMEPDFAGVIYHDVVYDAKGTIPTTTVRHTTRKKKRTHKKRRRGEPSGEHRKKRKKRHKRHLKERI